MVFSFIYILIFLNPSLLMRGITRIKIGAIPLLLGGVRGGHAKLIGKLRNQDYQVNMPMAQVLLAQNHLQP